MNVYFFIISFAVPYQQIAFSAYLNADEFAKSQILTCDTTVLNIGSHYDVNTGIFTCPVLGVYVFHVTLYVSPIKYVLGDIVKNGASVAWTIAIGTTVYEGIGSAMVTLSLDKGDMVWVKLHDPSSGAYIKAYKTAFSGFLLT